MKKIHQILGLSFADYEQLLFTNWMHWCESVSISPSEAAMIMVSASVNKWYIENYAECEALFLNTIKDYSHTAKVPNEIYRKCYDSCTQKMYNIFPKVLLAEAKKRELKPIKKVEGIRVQIQTYCMN